MATLHHLKYDVDDYIFPSTCGCLLWQCTKSTHYCGKFCFYRFIQIERRQRYLIWGCLTTPFICPVKRGGEEFFSTLFIAIGHNYWVIYARKKWSQFMAPYFLLIFALSFIKLSFISFPASWNSCLLLSEWNAKSFVCCWPFLQSIGLIFEPLPSCPQEFQICLVHTFLAALAYALFKTSLEHSGYSNDQKFLGAFQAFT